MKEKCMKYPKALDIAIWIILFVEKHKISVVISVEILSKYVLSYIIM